jgi:hypothetical protein
MGLAAPIILTVFDWLSNMTYWTSAFDCVEVRFKTEEKFYRNTEKLTLSMETLATVASPGHDMELLL